MAIPTAVNLREIAKSVFEESDNPNRYELIDDIIARVGKSGYESALRDALRMLVPQFSTQFRLSAMKSKYAEEKSETEVIDYSGLEELEELVGGERITSPRRHAVSQAWKNFMSQTIPTEDNHYIFLRDATVADLLFQYRTRINLMEGLRTQAEEWKRLADALAASGKTRLGEVNELVVFDVTILVR